MASPQWIEKLKRRWHVKSTLHVLIILLVFACTGFTVMFIKPFLLDLFFKDGKSPLFSILYWVLILPVYNLFLLFYGFIFGQLRFFWEFEKRLFRRITGKRKQEVKRISDPVNKKAGQRVLERNPNNE
jgi:hypothetical protein